MMKLVKGSELIGTVLDQDKEYFFGTGKRFTEDEYKQFIEDSYGYFEKFKEYTNKNRDEDEIKRLLSSYEIYGQKANSVYFSNPVYVYEDPNGSGYKYAGTNGRHRFNVSQKYNLKLLVNVIDSPEYSSEKIIENNPKKNGYIMRHIINFFRNIY